MDFGTATIIAAVAFVIISGQQLPFHIKAFVFFIAAIISTAIGDAVARTFSLPSSPEYSQEYSSEFYPLKKNGAIYSLKNVNNNNPDDFVSVDFSMSNCIKKQNRTGKSLHTIPTEILAFCSGDWDMPYVRDFLQKAKSLNITSLDFIEFRKDLLPDTVPDLSRKKFIEILRTQELMVREFAPDELDVHSFIKLSSLAHIYKSTRTDQLNELFQPKIIEKLKKLVKIYNPNKNIILRKDKIVELIVSYRPTTHVISNSFNNITVSDMAISLMFHSNYRRILSDLFQDTPDHFLSLQSKNEIIDILLLKSSVHLLNIESQILKKHGLELQRDPVLSKLKPIVLIVGKDLFKFSSCINTQQRNNKYTTPVVAQYCPEDSVIIAPTLTELGQKHEYFNFITPQIMHELYHAFLNPLSAPKSAFTGEVIATGRGEKAARIYEAALIFSKHSNNTNSMLDRFVSHITSPPGSINKVFNKDIKDIHSKITQQPLTLEDKKQACRAVSYLSDPDWLSGQYLRGMLSLSSFLFNRLSLENSTRAYAAAWSLGHFGKIGNENTFSESVDILPLFDVSKRLGKSQKNIHNDIKILDTLGSKIRNTLILSIDKFGC